MSDDDDFAPPAHICARCGFARGPSHVCRTTKKPMRQSYRSPIPSSKALGKRRADEWEVWEDSSDDDEEKKPLAPRLAKKARTAPPDSDPLPAVPAGPDPHAFLTSILHQHSALSKNLTDATTDNTKLTGENTKLTGENQKLAKELAKAKSDLTKAKAATTKEKKDKEKAQAAQAAAQQAAQAAAQAAAAQAAAQTQAQPMAAPGGSSAT